MRLELLRGGDPGSGLAQRGEHLLGRVADRRNDAHAGDDDASHRLPRFSASAWPRGAPAPARRRRGHGQGGGCLNSQPQAGASGGLEQANLQIFRLVYACAVGFQPAVRDAEHELSVEHALQVDAVDDPLDGRQHLVGELDLADAERATTSRQAEPAQVEAEQLPQRIEPEAARHDGVVLEVAGEEPMVRLDVEDRPHEDPCPLGPSVSEICSTASNISSGGSGSCGLPGPNSSPRAQARRCS